jgi:hypothetical protein
VGDTVEVMVEWWDDENEVVVLSKEKAEKVKVWDDIKTRHEADDTITGTITNRVKGGFSVDIGLQAFLPGSQADLRPIRNLDEMVGKEFDFKILKYNRKRSNIVLSRRVLLEEERERKAGQDPGDHSRRQSGCRYRQEPHRIRRVCRPGRCGRIAAHYRYLLGAGQAPVRVVHRGRRDQRQDPEPGPGT